MRVPYSKVPAKHPSRSFSLRPLLEVKLISGTRSVRTTAHVDTGADGTIVNRSWASALGIDVKKGVRSSTMGISPVGIPTFIHQIDIEIINLPESRRTIEVEFIESRNVNVLLGQVGFFQNYKVGFNQKENYFEIEV